MSSRYHDIIRQLLCNAPKHLEIRRKRLGSATRIVNDNIDTPTSRQTECHGHSMVIIRLNHDILIDLIILGRMNNTIILKLLHRRSQLGTFRHNRLHPLRLLETPRINIPNGRGSLRKERRHRQSHCRIGYLPAIDVHSLEFGIRIPRDGDGFGSPGDGGSHLFHDVGEGDVSLDAVASASADGDRPSRDGGSSEEVGGAAGVSFDEDGFGRGVFFGGGDEEGGSAVHVSLYLYVDAEFFHEADGEGYIGGGDEFVFDGDGDVSVDEGGSHEEGGEELG
mmetsp:Transcript_14909/g.30269  ORF Transcript_14909/g.30269 Transcript_14909/m.30269 type:complete len:279 (+) Transcript_14909:217-1053(+)